MYIFIVMMLPIVPVVVLWTNDERETAIVGCGLSPSHPHPHPQKGFITTIFTVSSHRKNRLCVEDSQSPQACVMMIQSISFFFICERNISSFLAS